jgi:hypothetical protein
VAEKGSVRPLLLLLGVVLLRRLLLSCGCFSSLFFALSAAASLPPHVFFLPSFLPSFFPLCPHELTVITFTCH